MLAALTSDLPGWIIPVMLLVFLVLARGVSVCFVRQRQMACWSCGRKWKDGESIFRCSGCGANQFPAPKVLKTVEEHNATAAVNARQKTPGSPSGVACPHCGAELFRYLMGSMHDQSKGTPCFCRACGRDTRLASGHEPPLSTPELDALIRRTIPDVILGPGAGKDYEPDEADLRSDCPYCGFPAYKGHDDECQLVN